MPTDTPEFWDEMWAGMEDCGSGSDEILAAQVERLAPGRALEVGCGTGGNATWLARQGWQVTAVDYSMVAIEKGRRLAAEQGVTVEFVVADASTYRPKAQYDLITSFYIQLFPAQRARMLANISRGLAPGGTLLFVSHDKSCPPSGWSEEDLQSLTTPEAIVAELSGLEIEQASTLNSAESAHESRMHKDGGDYESHEAYGAHGSSTTVVRAIWPGH